MNRKHQRSVAVPKFVTACLALAMLGCFFNHANAQMQNAHWWLKANNVIDFRESEPRIDSLGIFDEIDGEGVATLSDRVTGELKIAFTAQALYNGAGKPIISRKEMPFENWKPD